MSLPPGPQSPAWLQLLRWVLTPTSFMEACARRYGDTVSINMTPLGRIVMISDPAQVRTVFSGDADTWYTGTDRAELAAVVGANSLLTLQGDAHMRQRRLIQPSFQGERMRAYGSLIEEITRNDMATWPEGKPFALHPHMQGVTLDVILQAVFGLREGERLDALREALINYLRLGQSPLILLPWIREVTGTVNRFLVLHEQIDKLIYAEISERREASDLQSRTDILSLMLQARDENDQPMTDEELRDELVTLLLAGHETTATALAWTFERLVRHPEAMQRLVAEIDAGEEEKYLTAVIRESLRVRPVVPVFARRLNKPVTLGDYDYPRGTTIVPSVYLTNRNPERFPEPTTFRPERFLEDKPDPYTWIPFGGGLRRCIGASFAVYEMNTVIRTVLSHYSLAPDRPADERLRRRNITLTPSRGARVIAQPRTAR